MAIFGSVGASAVLAMGALAFDLPTASTSRGTQPEPSAAVTTPAGTPADPEQAMLRTLQVKAPLAQAPALIPKTYREPDAKSFKETSFVVASFNILGYGHTVKGGNRPGYADGRTRANWAVDLLQSHNVSVAGLQEFQVQQYEVFRRRLPGWGFYPGSSINQASMHNSIGWNTSQWELIEAETLPIPYFRGERVAMPHILLENRSTGRRVWFGNYHNPADSKGGAQGWRNLATRMEADLVNTLRAEFPVPVIMTGDFNDRVPFICPMTSQAPMHSADGAYTDDGGCRTPRRMEVDWIIGTPEASFSNYLSDESRLVNRTSDHPLIKSSVVIGPMLDRGKCITSEQAPQRTWCAPATG